MDRVRKIAHKGKTIVLIDFSNCTPDETLKVIPQAKKVVASCPPKSGLCLTDVNGAVYNKAVAEAIKDLTTHNTRFVKASAVVGVVGVQSILLQTVIFLTRRELKVFPDRLTAQDWLVSVN